MLLRALSFLDIPSLCTVAATCHAVHAAAGHWSIWSELWADRWPAPRDREEGKERWKAEYRQREIAERQHFFTQQARDSADERGERGAEVTRGWEALYAAQLRRERSRRRAVTEWEVIRQYRETHAVDASPHPSHHSPHSVAGASRPLLLSPLSPGPAVA